MKQYILLAAFIFVSASAMAQTEKVVAEKMGKGAVLIHDVQPKEGLYAIARLYNVSVTDLASANKLDKNAGLYVNQKLKIPVSSLEETRFGTGAPVYYVVEDKENLKAISNRFFDMPVKNIRIWNHLKEGEGVNKGQEIIVGYLPKGIGASEETIVKTTSQTKANNSEKKSIKQQAVITGTNINIRKGPSTNSDIIGSAQQYDIVEVLQKVNNEWTSIRTNSGVTGFVAAQFLEFSDAKQEASPVRKQPSKAIKTAAISGTNINIRKGPSTDDEVIAIAQQDDVVEILKKVNSEWTSIKTKDGVEGYIASQFVELGAKKIETKKEEVLKSAVISGTNINIRKGPSTEQEVVGIAQQDEIVSIIKKVNSEWTAIRTKEGTEGYIAAQFLKTSGTEATTKKTPEAKKAKVYGTNINIRKGPSTNQEVIAIAQQDDVLIFIKKVNDEWSEIQTGDGTEGFIATKFLSIDGNPALAAIEAEQLAKEAERIAAETAAKEAAIAEAKKKEEDKKATTLVSEKIMDKKADEYASATPDEMGYFKKDYEKLVNPNFTSQKTFASGIFKTDRGWNDGKYYLLMDEAAAGTLVKITNLANNKTVYAKVLGKMKGVQYGDGFDIRISEAAAIKLQTENTDKFNVAVTY